METIWIESDRDWRLTMRPIRCQFEDTMEAIYKSWDRDYDFEDEKHGRRDQSRRETAEERETVMHQ